MQSSTVDELCDELLDHLDVSKHLGVDDLCHELRDELRASKDSLFIVKVIKRYIEDVKMSGKTCTPTHARCCIGHKVWFKRELSTLIQKSPQFWCRFLGDEWTPLVYKSLCRLCSNLQFLDALRLAWNPDGCKIYIRLSPRTFATDLIHTLRDTRDTWQPTVHAMLNDTKKQLEEEAFAAQKKLLAELAAESQTSSTAKAKTKKHTKKRASRLQRSSECSDAITPEIREPAQEPSESCQCSSTHLQPSASSGVCEETSSCDSNHETIEPTVERSECAICLENPPCMAFVPCGHKAICLECSKHSKLQMRCIMCQKDALMCIRIW